MSAINTKEALSYFKKNDQIMARLLDEALQKSERFNLLTPMRPNQYFEKIASSIIGQQISTKAASAVRERVKNTLGKITPATVLEIDFDTLRSCGLSQKKTEYLKHNAEVWHEIPVRNFVHMTDEEVISELTKLYGIGRWTAEMFLMFSLARPDVFSYGDYGLMKSLYRQYNFKPHYTRKIRETVEAWSPHRTIASLALWHALDNAPQST